MNFVSVVLSLLTLVILPTVIGSGLITCKRINLGCYVDEKGVSHEDMKLGIMGKLTFSWLFGQLILWSVFQFIAVYNILKEHSYDTIKKEFVIVSAGLAAVSFIVFIISAIRKRKETLRYRSKMQNEFSSYPRYNNSSTLSFILRSGEAWEKILLAIVVIGIIVQVILQIRLAYTEVDDSYYVSEATAAIGADKLYYRIPYTGATTEFEPRHGLAPFPIWLAVVSDICKCSVVSMAHVLVPAIFLPLTYAVYALFGEILLGEKRRYLPVFMLFTELLTVFGFYSYMTPEKFFITRLREGKATIASLVIPGIILCLFMILKSLREDKKIDARLYILLFMLNTAGCLCSTLGALICVLPAAICAVLAIFMFKKGRHILPMVIASLPCAVFAGLYLVL